MKHVLALLGLGAILWASSAEAQSVGSPTIIQCNLVYSFTGLSANTVAVTGVSGRTINICGWNITNTAASGTFGITTGTGSTCGTGTATIAPAMSVAVGASSIDHLQGAFASAAQGADLCVNPSANTISGTIYYSINN